VFSARCFWAVFLVVLLVGLVPAAYAEPPDLSWIGGFWDDDDFDTVVAFIASTFATVSQSDLGPEPCLVCIASAEPASLVFVGAPLRSAARPRAPPITSQPLC
jgi:hypothetical protein